MYEFGWVNLEMDAWVNHEMDAWVNLNAAINPITKLEQMLNLVCICLKVESAWIKHERCLGMQKMSLHGFRNIHVIIDHINILYYVGIGNGFSFVSMVGGNYVKNLNYNTGFSKGKLPGIMSKIDVYVENVLSWNTKSYCPLSIYSLFQKKSTFNLEGGQKFTWLIT